MIRQGRPGEVTVNGQAGIHRVLLRGGQVNGGASIPGTHNGLELNGRGVKNPVECLVDVLSTLFSELVTVINGVRNALLHGHGTFTFGLDLQEACVGVEVAAGTHLEPVGAVGGSRVVADQIRGIKIDGVVGKFALPLNFEYGCFGGQLCQYRCRVVCVYDVFTVHAGLHGSFVIKIVQGNALPVAGNNFHDAVPFGRRPAAVRKPCRVGIVG